MQRGKTVMQMFLGVSPPDPPPNVPHLTIIATDVHGGVQTDDAAADGDAPQERALRELPQDHGPDRILAGKLRRRSDTGGPPTTAPRSMPPGVLVDGTKLDGVKGLREALLRYSPQFVRVITEKLMIYALGRGTEYFDMPLIRSIVQDADSATTTGSRRWSLGVVKSEPFQMNSKVQISANGQSEISSKRRNGRDIRIMNQL